MLFRQVVISMVFLAYSAPCLAQELPPGDDPPPVVEWKIIQPGAPAEGTTITYSPGPGGTITVKGTCPKTD